MRCLGIIKIYAYFYAFNPLIKDYCIFELKAYLQLPFNNSISLCLFIWCIIEFVVYLGRTQKLIVNKTTQVLWRNQARIINLQPHA